MSTAPQRRAMWTRRECIVTAALAQALPLASKAQARKPLTILVLGDSLSAEYGIARGSGWVSLLERRLSAHHPQAKVINASISGDTTSGGRARLPTLLNTHRPTHVIIELGGNDALRGQPLTATRNNLRAMIQASREIGAHVMLVGIQIPPNYGRQYAKDFAGMFSQVAETESTALVPFLLKGIADEPDGARQRFQADGIHPTASAHPKMLETVWQTMEPWLAKTH